MTLRIPQPGNYGANVDRATAPTLATSIATTTTNISVFRARLNQWHSKHSFRFHELSVDTMQGGQCVEGDGMRRYSGQ